MKRATTFGTIITVRHSDFNPRPREEGDIMISTKNIGKMISIHALVKRATIHDMVSGGR